MICEDCPVSRGAKWCYLCRSETRARLLVACSVPALLICSAVRAPVPVLPSLDERIDLPLLPSTNITYITIQCQLVHDQLRNLPRPLSNARLRYVIITSLSSSASLTRLQGAVYGKCIVANYQNAHKDMCAKEFMILKDCYLVCQALHCQLQSMLIHYQKAAGKKA